TWTRRLVIVAVTVLVAMGLLPTLTWILARDVALVRGQLVVEQMGSLEYLTLRGVPPVIERASFGDWIANPYNVTSTRVDFDRLDRSGLTPIQRRIVARIASSGIGAVSPSRAVKIGAAERRYVAFLEESSREDRESGLYALLLWQHAVRKGDRKAAARWLDQALERKKLGAELISEAKFRIETLTQRVGPLSRSVAISQYGLVSSPQAGPSLYSARATCKSLPLDHPDRRKVYQLGGYLADSAEFTLEVYVALAIQTAALGLPKQKTNLNQIGVNPDQEAALQKFIAKNAWFDRKEFDQRLRQRNALTERSTQFEYDFETSSEASPNAYRIRYGAMAFVLILLAAGIGVVAMFVRREGEPEDDEGRRDRAARDRELAIVLFSMALGEVIMGDLPARIGLVLALPFVWLVGRIPGRRGAALWCLTVSSIGVIGGLTGFPQMLVFSGLVVGAYYLPVGLLFGATVGLLAHSIVRFGIAGAGGLGFGLMTWFSFVPVAVVLWWSTRMTDGVRNALLAVAIALKIGTIPLDVQLDRRTERLLDYYGAGVSVVAKDVKVP
ncbi:MAG: hypothetical protein SFX74_09570, partial [Fimbriimonadaceae bacterium]|nr:hypothetical protein [Fimbriimonadaceae bacterium]